MFRFLFRVYLFVFRSLGKIPPLDPSDSSDLQEIIKKEKKK